MIAKQIAKRTFPSLTIITALAGLLFFAWNATTVQPTNAGPARGTQGDTNLFLKTPNTSCLNSLAKISLSWNDQENQSRVSVLRSSNGSNWIRIATVRDATTYQDIAVLGNTAYSYRLQMRKNGSYTYSNVVSITTDACGAVKENEVGDKKGKAKNETTSPETLSSAQSAGVFGAGVFASKRNNTRRSDVVKPEAVKQQPVHDVITVQEKPSPQEEKPKETSEVEKLVQQKAVEKPSEKPIEIPSEKQAEKPVEKPAEEKPVVEEKPNVETKEQEPKTVVPEVVKEVKETIPPVIEPKSSGYPLSWGTYTGWRAEDVTEFESKLGSSFDLLATFVHWGNNNSFPLYFVPFAKDKGRTLVIFWEASDYTLTGYEHPKYSYDAILRGDWNAYLDSFAKQAKQYGGPVILIPFSEMNGNWSPWSGVLNGNTPAKAVAAFRYVKERFTGVSNVKFGWAPNSTSWPNTPENQIEKYYPGDAYVDYVGVDGFNFGNPWKTFDQTFGDALTRIAKYNKPMYVFSMGSAEGPQKAAWITDALTVQMPKYPLLKGWVWFNENKEKDWRLWSDAASLAATKKALGI